MGLGSVDFSGPAFNFPGRDTWQDFDTLYNFNKPEMLASGGSGPDAGCIYNAIDEAAKIGVEQRVILAIIMQESSGNVGAKPTFNGGPADAGMMQYEGSTTFSSQITDMIMAGTKHFRGNLQSNNDSDTAEAIYDACRLYNSGLINKGDLSDAQGPKQVMLAT